MLNKRERYKVLKIFRICCNLGQFPLQVDLASWQLNTASTRRKCSCIASYILFVLHVLYKSAGLAYALFFVPDVPLHQLVIHAVMAVGSITLAFWYHELYISSPGLFATLVKTTLLGNVGGSLGPSDQLEKEWKIRLKEYSLQDLIAVSLFYMVMVCAAFVVASYIYDPSMRLLLYAALSNRLQNWATFSLCLLEEIRFVIICMTMAVTAWQHQVISFDLVTTKLQLLMKGIQNGARTSRSVYTYLRCLQLYVSTFNKVNSYVIFTWKLLCISLCTVSGYAAIAHFQEHPVFGCMYYVILIDCMIVYSVIYGKAFRIPQLFEQTTALAMLHKHGNQMVMAGLFRRQMLSIPRIGIKVGHFHVMERESTLIFVDYVVVNIVNMLVAYG